MTDSDLFSCDPSSSFDAWFGSLGAITPARHGDAAAHKEGQFMRHLLSLRAQATHQEEPVVPNAAEVQRHWNNVLERARHEGLFEPRTQECPKVSEKTPPPALHRPHLLKAANQRLYAMAAGIAAMTIGISVFVPQALQDHQSQEEPTGEVIFRGDEQAQRIPVPAGSTAGQVADRVEQVLKAHGIPYRRITLSPLREQIQAKVTPESAAAQALSRLGVTVPRHGRLNLVVEPAKDFTANVRQ